MPPSNIIIVSLLLVSLSFLWVGGYLAIAHYPDPLAILTAVGFMWISWVSKIQKDDPIPDWYVPVVAAVDVITMCGAWLFALLYVYLITFGG